MLYQNTVADPRDRVVIWERADGSLLGFALLDGGSVEPQPLTDDEKERAHFGADVLDLAVQRMPPEADAELRTEVLDQDPTWRLEVERRGFMPDMHRRTRRGEPYSGMVRFACPLSAQCADLVDGQPYLVRPVGDEGEWSARVDLHREVWAPSKVTLEAYARLRAAPVYRPDLDLVAVDHDGSLVAYAIIWFDPRSGVGEFEPVGTHPDHRRRVPQEPSFGRGCDAWRPSVPTEQRSFRRRTTPLRSRFTRRWASRERTGGRFFHYRRPDA